MCLQERKAQTKKNTTRAPSFGRGSVLQTELCFSKALCRHPDRFSVKVTTSNLRGQLPVASLGLQTLSFEAGHAGASCAPAAGEDYCILLGFVRNVGIVLKWKHWLTLAQLFRENQKHKLQPLHDISDCVTYLILILLSFLSPEERDLFLWIWCGGADCELNTVRLLELT